MRIKIALLFVWLCTVLYSSAQEVGYQEAKAKAVSFFENMEKAGGQLKSASAVQVDSFATYFCQNQLKSAGQAKDPAFYIFNRADQSGFVIVSADKRIKDIIAYSNKSKFSVHNLGLNELLKQYSSEISFAKDKNLKSASIGNESSNVSTGTWLLGDIEWDQDPVPFNALCPNNSLAGCVAIAMSQIIYYHKYPRHGLSSHSYTSDFGKLEADFENTEYKYELMKDKPAIGISNNYISNLIYHVGVSVDMDYGAASSSNIYKAEKAFESFFNYSDCKIKDLTFTSWTNWKELIRTEIDNKRPIYYRAVDLDNIFDSDDPYGGHAFVLDGYNLTDDTYHINWGWGNMDDCNGFYSLNLLDVNVNSTVYKYNYWHKMLIGIEPANPDVTCPKVTSAQHTNSLTPDIQLQFSEPLSEETIENRSNFLLAGDKSGTITFANPNYNPETKLLTITPTVQLAYKENIILTVKSAVTDLAGNSLDGDGNGSDGPDYVYPFTTPACPNDLAAVSITVSKQIPDRNEDVTVTATIKNVGTTTTSLNSQIHLYDNGLLKESYTFTELAPEATKTHTFIWKATSGSHTIKVEAVTGNDCDAGNNSLSTKVYCENVGTFVLNESINQSFEATVVAGSQKAFLFSLSNATENPVSVTISSGGNYASWIRPAGPNPLEIAAGSTRSYPFVIAVPGGVATGTYTGNLIFSYADNTKTTVVQVSIDVKHVDGLLAAYEYWFDNDYSTVMRSGSPITNDYNLSKSLQTKQLANGFHTLHIRFADSNGAWSSVQTEPFVKMPPRIYETPLLAGYEYWFDGDYTQRRWKRILPTKLTTIFEINLQGLASGVHTMYYRFRDDAGQWSSVNTQQINKYPERNGTMPAITMYEYWFGNDYENRRIINVSPNQLFDLQKLDVNGIAPGFYTLHIRYRDDAGRWSSVSTDAINIYPPRAVDQPKIARYEYWFNNNYDVRHQVNVAAQETYTINSIDVSDLADGAYQLNMRFQDDAGRWSSISNSIIQKLPLRQTAANRIIAYRYWFDNDFDNRKTEPISSIDLSFVSPDFNPVNFSAGEHFFHFQTCDENHTWSTVTSLRFEQNPVLPAVPVVNLPTGVTQQGFTVSWNEVPGATSYFLYVAMDESFTNLILSKELGVSTQYKLSGIDPGTNYYIRVKAYNQTGLSEPSNIVSTITLPAGTGCVFNDCSSPENCGGATYEAETYEAVQYLCERGIIETANVSAQITRGQLAKIAFFGVFNGAVNVPEKDMLVSDFFPNPFSDLQSEKQSTEYYYRAARALVYLDHGDGIAPFDRDQQWFRPNNFISRQLVLKVLFETFNIKPSKSTDPVFLDFSPEKPLYGYAKRAKELGITTATYYRPEENCTRAEAFIFLYRIMSHAEKLIPKINNTLDLATSSFYVPANASIASMLGGWGIESGNFNHYTKSCFSIPGRNVSLDFGFTYNSIMTEFPGELYPIQPLGKGWSHTWNMYMNYFVDPDTHEIQIAVHMPDGQIMFYGVENGETVPQTFGNYNKLTFNQNDTKECWMTTKSQVVYTFKKIGEKDAAYMLTSVKDRHNDSISISYRVGPKYTAPGTKDTLTTRLISEVVDPTGRKLIFTYDTAYCLASVTDPIERVVRFNYTNKQLTKFTDAKQQITTYSYGTTAEETRLNLLRKIKLPKGNEITNEYLQRKLTSTQFNANSPTLITHNPNYVAGKNNFYKSTVTTPQQNGQVITTNYEMDALGNTTKVTGSNAVNISSTYTDAAHPKLPTSISNNMNNMSFEPSYDARGNVDTITTKGNGITFTETFIYNMQNDLIEHTNANGYTTKYLYNGGNLVEVTDALNNETKIEYNQHGQPTKVTNPMENVVTFGYNQFGNQNEVNIPILSLKASMQYDDVSRMVNATNFNGQTNTYAYDANDNLLTETDAMNHTTSYDYDENENLKSITNAKGGRTEFEYDFLTDWLKTESFQGAVKTYNYNADGSLKSFTDPNQVTSNYIYDSAGRIKSDGYATYTYYANGNLESITRSGKAIYFYYDGLNQVSSISYDGQTVAYTYDNVGNLLTMTYPGGKVVTYTYDALERMKTVTDWNGQETKYFYRSDGQLDYTWLPNDVKMAISYDEAGRPVTLSSKRKNGTEIAGYTFTLDALGNHLSEEMREPFETYPDLSDTTINYTYNSANRLLAANNLTFGYDNNGNTKSKTGYQFTYDDQDNLIAVGGRFNARYAYDGAGNRRQATRNGVVTKYVLDILGMSNVLMETDANNTPLNYYVYGLGLISRIKPDNTTHYYVYDYRGSTVAMVDATQDAVVTHKYQYDEFGNLQQTAEADANLFRYVGKYGVMYEADAIQFMRARYYDPSIGRFLSEDPVWSTNLYPYGNNSAINNIDPKGMFFSQILGIGTNVVTGIMSHEMITAMAIARLGGYKNAGSLFKAIAVIETIQGNSPEEAANHAMAGKIGTNKKGEPIYESRVKAKARSIKKAEILFKMGEIGSVLHIIQDSYAPGHNYKEWDGKVFKHVINGSDVDNFAALSASYATYRFLRDIRDGNTVKMENYFAK